MLKFYVFDRFIYRLAKSQYKDNFILKGGFLLSALFGIENRSTMDIDAAVVKPNFTKKKILEMVGNIISIELNDNVKFSISGVESIRVEDKYGGYRINLLFQFENIKETLNLDIVTGDPITPKAITYKYKTILNNNYVSVWSYNYETILAEKIETIFGKVEVSSRMKDYYDIYLIYKLGWADIDLNNFRKAVENTFNKRKFNSDLYETFKIIKESFILRKKWDSYSRKYDYAKGLSYDEVISCIEKVIEVLTIVKI